MREAEIRQLIRMVEESDIESLEIRRFFRTIRITKRSSANSNGSSHHAPPHLVDLPVPQAAPASAPVVATPAPAPAATPEQPSNLIEVKSPMVGTFYSAPAPGSPPFVEVNKTVAQGDVLCIIEAMKLMNEIEAEQSGRIAKLMVENGQPIEYGQVLFLLDPS